MSSQSVGFRFKKVRFTHPYIYIIARNFRVCKPNQVPGLIEFYASLVRECGNAKELWQGRCIHQRIISDGFSKDRFLGNLLIQMYGKCGSLEDAWSLFDKMRNRNVFSWAIMIAACAQCKCLQDALWVFNKMPEPNIVAYNSVILAYVQCEDIEGGRTFFDTMPFRNVVSWTSMIAAYVQIGNGKEALNLYHTMQLWGVAPDQATFVCVLDACAIQKFLEEGRRVHKHILSRRLQSDVVVGTVLVNMYAKCGSMVDAQLVFNEMPEQSTVSWNVLLSAYAHNGDVEEAQSVFDKMPVRNIVSWTTIIAASAHKGHIRIAFGLLHQMQDTNLIPNNITFLTLIDACANHSMLPQGKLVHNYIVTYQVDLDNVLGTALISMYGKCSSIKDAKCIFDVVPEHSTSLCNAMMSAHILNGNAESAQYIFDTVPNRDIVSWNTMLSAHLNSGKIDDALMNYENMRCHNVVTWTLMVSAYARQGNLEDAQKTFDKIPEPDIFAVNALISSYAQYGDLKKLVLLFQKMQMQGFKPDKLTFKSILLACAAKAAFAEGKRVQSHIIHHKIALDATLGGTLISMYGKCSCIEDAYNTFTLMSPHEVASWNALISAYTYCGTLEEVERVFKIMPQRNVVSWNSMFTVYAQYTNFKKTFDLFHQMKVQHIVPDDVTFIIMMDACATQVALGKGKWIHCQIYSNGLHVDQVLGTALVNMYGKCGCLHSAEKTFDRLSERNTMTWNSMIASYGQAGCLKSAERLFAETPEQNMASWNMMLTMYGQCRRLDEAQRAFDRMPKHDIISWNAMITANVQHGDLVWARRVFDAMPAWNTISWDIIIKAYVEHGHKKDAFRLFQSMERVGLIPNEATVSTLIDCCAMQQSLYEGKLIHGLMILNKVDIGSFLGTSLVSMYAKCRDVAAAHRTFEKIPERDTVSWNAMISGYSRCGYLQEALRTFNEMQQVDIASWNTLIEAYADHGQGRKALQILQNMQLSCTVPNKITVINILNACNHSKLVDEGFHLFAFLTSYYHIVPMRSHYDCLVNLVGRIGQLDEAEDMINNVPLAVNALAWMTLLSSCRMFIDLERSKRASEQLFMFDPQNAAAYVLLSNIYVMICKQRNLRYNLEMNESLNLRYNLEMNESFNYVIIEM